MLLRTFLTNKKSCLLKKDSESQNLIALILINKIYHSKSQHVWMKLWLNQEQKSVHVNIFSVLFLSDKEELQRYFQVNTKSYDWSWVNFCTLIFIYLILIILILRDYALLTISYIHFYKSLQHKIICVCVWRNFMCEISCVKAWHDMCFRYKE